MWSHAVAAAARAGPSRLMPLRSSALRLRALATARPLRQAAAASQLQPPPVAPSLTAVDHDGIRPHFDEPAPSPSGLASPVGLFGYAPLTHAGALQRLVDRTLVHARAIVARISRAPRDPTARELRLVVKNLDRLSDLLCGVIDMCELVRNAHPEPGWVDASDRAYERLCSYMNELNTDRGLFEALKATIDHPHAQPYNHAEMQVALTFLRDFEKSGIDLPPAARSRFVDLSDSLLQLGRSFLTSASAGPTPFPPIEIPDPEKNLVGLGAQFVDSLPRKRGKALVAPGSWEAQMIMRYAREGEARRLVLLGSQRADPDRIEVLETMLRQRADLAGVLGKESYAELALVDKMAKTPANVDRFLLSLAEHHRPAAAADVATLQRLKAMTLTGNAFSAESPVKLPPLNAWDRDFFTERHVQSQSPTRMLPPISPYFSTGTVLRGLSRLFSRLYGISFRPAPVAPGEVWHDSVRRLDVVDEDEGRIGVIYCDLFSRDGKPAAAAHYTVRCSRRVDDDDVTGDGLRDGWDSSSGPGLETDGDAVRGKEGRYQLPIVVLTTDFGTVEPGKPALLSWNDVETLFHEMGHAMHSMIGRTEFHNVSGTRCATDFVELPSILMEHFVSSPTVLSIVAGHYATDEPLPMSLLQAHTGIQQSLSALETHGQIVMALLDQRYHSLRPGSAERDGFDSTQVYFDLQNEVGVVPPAPGAAWQTQFGHLFGYGATYYSYLFDRAISGKVWASLFAGDPLSREGGEYLKRRVLAYGGGRDPWEMVGDVVGGHEGDVVSRGDERAMAVVGGWTVKERGVEAPSGSGR